MSRSSKLFDFCTTKAKDHPPVRDYFTLRTSYMTTPVATRQPIGGLAAASARARQLR